MFLSQRFLNVLSEVRNTFFVRRPGGPEKKTRLRTQLSPRAEDKVAQIKFLFANKMLLVVSRNEFSDLNFTPLGSAAS
jgi:hypothetical protein